VDLSRDWSARQRGEELFAQLPPAAVYVGGWGDVPILDYLQLVEKQREDVETLNVFLATQLERSQFVERRLGSGRPVYVASIFDIPYVTADFEYVPACRCFRVRLQSPGPETPAAPAHG
jgi:hypothetical protein